MEIDKKQFQAWIKSAKSERPRNDYMQGYRHGLDDAFMFAKRLSSGWRYLDGKWISPETGDKL